MENIHAYEPWNKGRLIGQKPPLKLKDIWAIRIHLQIGKRIRDLAMFNLAIDSKLRGCDLVNLRVRDIAHSNHLLPRAMIMQRKTQRPVQFELTEQSRADQRGCCRMDCQGQSQARRILVSQSFTKLSTHLNTSVRANRTPMGQFDWPRSRSLWHTHNASYQGDLNLSPN